jgi:hypothetical protein
LAFLRSNAEGKFVMRENLLRTLWQEDAYAVDVRLLVAKASEVLGAMGRHPLATKEPLGQTGQY